MRFKLFQIDAFTDHVFKGNPAAICPLDAWLPEATMQRIAQENNLSETAFFVPNENGFDIRWFTPVREVDLCGHATLASAYVLFNELGYDNEEIVFHSKSGALSVCKQGDWLSMDFPAQPPHVCDVPSPIQEALQHRPTVCSVSVDYIVELDNEDLVLQSQPDMVALKKLDHRGVILTAASEKYDFVSRFFAPKYGIDEDPVTGSAFTQLIPYWSQKLSKKTLFAKQVSARGGEVRCLYNNDRVNIAGQAIKYMQGTIILPD